ncbi:MAG: zinc-dependent metalloprotease [Polyangiales bacterium]
MHTYLRGILGTSAIGLVLFGQGCATDRPSRNGVFNENQYVRKDFLTQAVDGNGNAVGADPGWVFRASVTEASTPNLLGATIGIWGGAQGQVDIVRFRVTQDKLQMLTTRQFSMANDVSVDPTGASNTTGVTPAIANAWSATNVDLKYQVNLDGERTNFFQENQELDWQQRQWVKLSFAKNDFSDFAPLDYMGYTSDLMGKCADTGEASATLVDGSFNVEGTDTADISDDYFEFTVQVGVTMKFDDTTCIEAYGPMLDSAVRLGRQTATANIKYSFKRANPNPTYVPFPLDEKDPIYHKYGPFTWIAWNRDPATNLIAAQGYVGRFDPAKDIVWTFDPGFPARYKTLFTGDTTATPPYRGLVDQTNDILTAAGSAGRVKVQEAPAGVSFGDVRYNFLRWVTDEDMQDSFAGVTEPGFDPRTGEIVNETVEMNDFAVKDYYVQRLDAFLQQIGVYTPATYDPTTGAVLTPSTWPSGTCTAGAVAPLVDSILINKHNANSTVFAKMQTYLGLHTPDAAGDHMGVSDMVNVQDTDFMTAYLALAPYQVFSDPATNAYVTPEGGTGVYGPSGLWTHLQDSAQFHSLMSSINKGESPFTMAEGKEGVYAAANFMNNLRSLAKSNRELADIKRFQTRDRHMDTPGMYSLENVILKDSVRCVGGNWETHDQWAQSIIDGYWTQVIWHEFGHSMGLEHNFMGNIDAPNFATYKDAAGKTQISNYTSSVMEYSAAPDRLWWTPQWGAYDKGAIAWIYANNGRIAGAARGSNLSGQVDATTPFKDPMGFDSTGKVENQFLRCDDNQMKYSPLCQQGDLGVTPSQIVANAIDSYEWGFPYRNFRSYHKTFNFQAYGDAANKTFSDLRRFMSQWAFDWGEGEITDTLRKIGITPPASVNSNQNYYAQLAQKFNTEMSVANRLVASFHQAVVAQGSGERPFATVFDKFYGDEVQQGIIIDKLIAVQQWVGLWQTDNYDQNQAGVLFSSFALNFGDPSYQAVTEAAANFMVGGSPAAYAYFSPATVSLFAQDTHNPTFLINWSTYRTEVKDWIGGWTFTREQDLIDFFKNIAVSAGTCTDFKSCTYDATTVAKDPNNNDWVGPDALKYILAYLPSRNEWVLARKDRNVATYIALLNYNQSILGQHEDGTNGAYALEYNIKYLMDAYAAYEQP